MKTFSSPVFRLSTIIFLLLQLKIQSQTPNPAWQWAKRVGSSGDNIPSISGDEAFNDVKVDKVGNVYAVGNFFANTAFQNAQLFGQTTPLGFGQDDAYLMKYNACGSLLWWRRMGGTNIDGATSLVIDNSENILVLGYNFSVPSQFTGGASTFTTNNGPQFVAKFDTSGTLIGVNTYSTFFNKILMRSQGDYLLTSGVSAAILNTTGVITSTIAFFSPTTPFLPSIYNVTLDRLDNIYLSGYFDNTVTINPSTTIIPVASTLIANSYAGNSLLLKLNSNGSLLWFQRGYSAVSDAVSACAVDSTNNNLAVVGRAWNYSQVFTSTVASSVGSYCNPIFYINGLNGSSQSVITGTANLQGRLYSLSFDRDNNLHLAGKTNGFISFGSTTVTVGSPSSNWQNIIAKFSPSSSLSYLNLVPQSGSAPGNDDIFGLAISEQGNVYVAGMFGGTLDSAGTAVIKIGGAEDGFVAKFGLPCASTLSLLSPLAPASLSATYQGSLSNVVNWVDNSNYESAYELWAVGGSIPSLSLIATLPPNTVSYTHTALNYASSYCYKARAINNIGPSVFTNSDCASTPAMAVPQAPTSLVAANAGTLVNNINWVDNSFNETGFELWYHGSNPTFSLLTTLPANTTTYTHTGLSYTTTYCYKALATNSIGPSVFTNTDCATTPQAPLPNAPTNLTAANTGTLVNTVNWVDNSNNETGFELWYNNASSATFSLLSTLPANTTTYTHTGLSYTTTYCYKALATNSVGASVFTNTDCATTPAAIVDETGIAKHSTGLNYSIYPNPSKGVFTIEFAHGAKPNSIIVTDAIGRLVKEEQFTSTTSSNNFKLILSAPQGLYFAKITTGNGTYTEKLIIE